MPAEIDPTATETQQGSAQPSVSRSLEESVMNVIGVVAAIIISGFVVYRWQSGDHTRALINIVIIVMVVGSILLGRKPRFRQIALLLFGVTVSVSCLMSSLLVSSNGLLWALLSLLVNCLILERRWALVLNGAVILILTLSVHLYQSLLHQVSWTTVATLITGFSLTMMDQLRDQRAQLAEQATVDPLTGAGNRRLMAEQLQALVDERRQGERSGTLMVLDLDKFKRINDTHGHDTGDRVLREFVQSIRSSLRTNDGLYRMGGEEFVILLRGMDETTAKSYLPDLHRRLTGQVEVPDGVVEFSAGVAVLREAEGWSQWLARADEALYASKSSGRNRLTFSET